MDNEQSYSELKFGDSKGERESVTVAAEELSIRVNYFKSKILNDESDSKCRLWKQQMTA